MHISDETIREVETASDILQVISEVMPLEKQGRDYFGCCPFHNEKTPSFSVSTDKQFFYCFGCGESGGVIHFVMKNQGITFPEAVKRLADRCGVVIPETKAGRSMPHMPRAPQHREKPRMNSAPDSAVQVPSVPLPPAKWREKATALVKWAHESLQQDVDQLKWLKARGIQPHTINLYSIGWNPGREGRDLWRPRESWSLSTELKDNGRKKRLWIPKGLIIPLIKDDEAIRIRVRRPEGEPRYYNIPGSDMRTMVLRHGSRAYIVVESELDAFLIDQLAGDVVGTVALGAATARPDASTIELLQKAAVILNALDYDAAGAKAQRWWREVFPDAERWPVPKGKDPGEAHQAGVDLRQWVLAALPRSFHPPPAKARVGLSALDNEREGDAQSLADTEDTGAKTTELPEGVCTLAGYLRKYPVKIRATPKRLTLLESSRWTRDNWAASQKISELIFFDPEVTAYLIDHPEEIITGHNIILKGDTP